MLSHSSGLKSNRSRRTKWLFLIALFFIIFTSSNKPIISAFAHRHHHHHPHGQQDDHDHSQQQHGVACLQCRRKITSLDSLFPSQTSFPIREVSLIEKRQIQIGSYDTNLYTVAHLTEQDIENSFSITDVLNAGGSPLLTSHGTVDRLIQTASSSSSSSSKSSSNSPSQFNTIMLFQDADVVVYTSEFVLKQQPALLDLSWFLGYLVRPIYCPNCGAHIGWQFIKYSSHHHIVDRSSLPPGSPENGREVPTLFEMYAARFRQNENIFATSIYTNVHHHQRNGSNIVPPERFFSLLASRLTLPNFSARFHYPNISNQSQLSRQLTEEKITVNCAPVSHQKYIISLNFDTSKVNRGVVGGDINRESKLDDHSYKYRGRAFGVGTGTGVGTGSLLKSSSRNINSSNTNNESYNDVDIQEIQDIIRVLDRSINLLDSISLSLKRVHILGKLITIIFIEPLLFLHHMLKALVLDVLELELSRRPQPSSLSSSSSSSSSLSTPSPLPQSQSQHHHHHYDHDQPNGQKEIEKKALSYPPTHYNNINNNTININNINNNINNDINKNNSASGIGAATTSDKDHESIIQTYEENTKQRQQRINGESDGNGQMKEGVINDEQKGLNVNARNQTTEEKASDKASKHISSHKVEMAQKNEIISPKGVPANATFFDLLNDSVLGPKWWLDLFERMNVDIKQELNSIYGADRWLVFFLLLLAFLNIGMAFVLLWSALVPLAISIVECIEYNILRAAHLH